MSSILGKKERGNLLAFRIEVKKDSKENLFHTNPVTKNTHGSSSSLYSPKRSFYKVGGADFLPQGLLGSLKLPSSKSPPLSCRTFHLIKREQIVDL